MKSLVFTGLILFSNFAFSFESDKASTLEAEQQFFQRTIRLSGDEIRGEAAGVLEPLQTGKTTTVKFYRNISGDTRMTITTSEHNSWHHHHFHVLFPTSGKVVFELKDASGEYVKARVNKADELSESTTLSPKSNVLYIVETDTDYQARQETIERFNEKKKDPARQLKNTNRFIAKAEYGLYEYTIIFYEIIGENEKGEMILKESGFFSGSPKKRK